MYIEILFSLKNSKLWFTKNSYKILLMHVLCIPMITWVPSTPMNASIQHIDLKTYNSSTVNNIIERKRAATNKLIMKMLFILCHFYVTLSFEATTTVSLDETHTFVTHICQIPHNNNLTIKTEEKHLHSPSKQTCLVCLVLSENFMPS